MSCSCSKYRWGLLLLVCMGAVVAWDRGGAGEVEGQKGDGRKGDGRMGGGLREVCGCGDSSRIWARHLAVADDEVGSKGEDEWQRLNSNLDCSLLHSQPPGRPPRGSPRGLPSRRADHRRRPGGRRRRHRRARARPQPAGAAAGAAMVLNDDFDGLLA